MTRDDLSATERWLNRRGVPTFIHNGSGSRRALTRALPFLIGLSCLLFALELLGSVTSLASLLRPIAMIFIGIIVVSYLRWRIATRALRTATICGLLVLYLGLPLFGLWVLWWHAGLEYVAGPLLPEDEYLDMFRPEPYQRDETLADGTQTRIWVQPNPSPDPVYVMTYALIKTAIILVAVGLISFVAAALGIVSLTRTALVQAVRDVRTFVAAQAYFVPILLAAFLFLFFSAEIWQVADSISWLRLSGTLGLFGLVAVVPTVSLLRQQVGTFRSMTGIDHIRERTKGTPAAAYVDVIDADRAEISRLTVLQWLNLLLLLVSRQAVLALGIATSFFAFFVVLGTMTVSDGTSATWLGHAATPLFEPDESANGLWSAVGATPAALVRSAMLLAAFGTMSFVVTLTSERKHRAAYLSAMLADALILLAVRVTYRAGQQALAQGAHERRHLE